MDIYKDRIRPLFDGSGLSDREIALKIGIPVKLIYNWNNGVKSYNKYFDKIANYFHVSVEYLKGETDDKNPPPVGDGQNSKVINFLLSLPQDRLWGILLALGAPEDVLAELDQQEPQE